MRLACRETRAGADILQAWNSRRREQVDNSESRENIRSVTAAHTVLVHDNPNSSPLCYLSRCTSLRLRLKSIIRRATIAEKSGSTTRIDHQSTNAHCYRSQYHVFGPISARSRYQVSSYVPFPGRFFRAHTIHSLEGRGTAVNNGFCVASAHVLLLLCSPSRLTWECQGGARSL